VTAAQPGPGTSACSAAPGLHPFGDDTFCEWIFKPDYWEIHVVEKDHPTLRQAPVRFGAEDIHAAREQMLGLGVEADEIEELPGVVLVQLHRSLGQPARPLPGPVVLAIRAPAASTHRPTMYARPTSPTRFLKHSLTRLGVLAIAPRIRPGLALAGGQQHAAENDIRT
jgi:hypothetical protein